MPQIHHAVPVCVMQFGANLEWQQLQLELLECLMMKETGWQHFWQLIHQQATAQSCALLQLSADLCSIVCCVDLAHHLQQMPAAIL